MKTKNISGILTSRIKNLDREVILQGALYDEVTERVVVTLVKGRKRTSFILNGRWFDNDHGKLLDETLKEEVKRLKNTPAG
jgi:hypothetical protein